MQLNRNLRYIIIGGIFLLPFIPFIITKSLFFPFIVGKNFAFRIIIEIIFAGWIVLAWRDARYRLTFSWVWAALAVFVGVVALADIFGEDFFRSFWSNYERMDGLITLLHLFAFFIVTASVMNTKTLWMRFLQTSLGVSVIMSLYGILQLAGKIVINQGGVRVDATLGNATYFAGYLLFHIFFAAFLFAQKSVPNWLKWLYGGIIALHVFMLFNTMTRGAILALLGGTILITLLLLFFGKSAPTLKKYAAGILGGVIVLVGVFVIIKDTQFIKENQIFDRLAGISIEAGKSRFLVWGVAWEGIKEHPILGWGQDNFIVAFSKHYDSRMYTEEPWFDRAHNIVFDWLVAGGTLTLVSYVSIFAALIYALWFYPKRRIHDERGTELSFEPLSVFEKSILTGLIAAYIFHNLFVFDNVVSYTFFFAILAFVHRASYEKPPPVFARLNKVTVPKKDFILQLVGPVVLIALIFSLYTLNVKHILANRSLLKAIDIRAAQETNSPEERETILRGNLQSFQKALSRGHLGRTEAREQLIQTTSIIADAPVSQIIKQEFFTLATSEIEKQIIETPNNLRPRIFKSSLLLRYRLFDEAILELEEALKVSDKKQDMYLLLSNAYLNVGNTEKAIETIRRSFLLEESNTKVRKAYAATLIRAGRAQEAEELLSALDEKNYAFDADIVNAYVSIGRTDKLTAFLEEQIKQQPDNVQAYISLSAAYLESGNRLKAIAKIEEAIERFPTFKEQGEFFIREIKAGRNP